MVTGLALLNSISAIFEDKDHCTKEYSICLFRVWNLILNLLNKVMNGLKRDTISSTNGKVHGINFYMNNKIKL